MSLAIPRGTVKPVIWAIGGSDCASAAGVQTDLKALTALGAHGCTVITSITAQNTAAVTSIEAVSPRMLLAQMEALQEDLPPQAIKIGMLGDEKGVRVLAAGLEFLPAFTIYDPVLLSSSGARLVDEATQAVMRQALLPQVDLLTPNRAEAEMLSSIKIGNDEDVEKAARELLKTGVQAVLIKGWDSGAGYVQDFYFSAERSFWLTLPQHQGEVPRGTGCTFASVLAAAHGFGLECADAAVIAKAYVHRGLRQNRKLGKGPPVIEHQAWPVDAEDMPWLTLTASAGRSRPVFSDCGAERLGFYPVVDSTAWLRRLLPLGVRTAQLRVKNLQGEALRKELAEGIELARQTGTRLFINDYWQMAIELGAYGVHLGQEDLDDADIQALAASGLRLGISTHGYAELARAMALRPSYIALGPIFPTTLKAMKVAPQGIETLQIWRQLVTCPLVAIGGIKLEQAAEIYDAGADSIAVVSDVTQNAMPEARVGEWLKLTEMRKGAVGEGNSLAVFP